MDRWDAQEYLRIESAVVQEARVVVRFEDGAVISIAKDDLIDANRAGAAWDRVTTEPFAIRVPVDGEEFEISSTSLRSLTDRDFNAHLVQAAARHASQIGLGIRVLRERRRLSSKELAQRAGITAQSMSRIEHGKHDVTFTTLRRILAAMDFSLKDLATVSEEDATVEQRQVRSGKTG